MLIKANTDTSSPWIENHDDELVLVHHKRHLSEEGGSAASVAMHLSLIVQLESSPWNIGRHPWDSCWIRCAAKRLRPLLCSNLPAILELIQQITYQHLLRGNKVNQTQCCEPTKAMCALAVGT